jgi:hypothetical protein
MLGVFPRGLLCGVPELHFDVVYLSKLGTSGIRR